MVNGIIIQNTGTDATINSGNAIWFDKSVNLTYAVKKVQQVPKNNSGELQEIQQSPGVENSPIVLQFRIDLSSTDGSYEVNGESNCVKATPQLMNDLVSLTHSTNSQLKLTAYWGSYEYMFYENTNSINVAVDTITWVDKPNTVNTSGGFNPIRNGTLTLKQVKAI